MKLLALLVMLVVYSLTNQAAIEIHGEKNDVIPRGIKEKGNHDTTQEKERQIFAVEPYNIIRGVKHVYANGTLGQIFFYSTAPIGGINNGSWGRLIYYNTTSPLYFAPEPEPIYKQSEEFSLTTKQSDKKFGSLMKRYNKLGSNELNTNYHKDFELRTYPKVEIANSQVLLKIKSGNGTRLVKYRILDNSFNSSNPEELLKEIENAIKLDPVTEFHPGSKSMISEFSGKSYNRIESNGKYREKFESDRNNHKDFESRAYIKGLKPEEKNITLHRDENKNTEESKSNAAGSKIVINPNLKPSKNFPDVLKSNEKQPVKYESNGNNLEAFRLKMKQQEIFDGKENHSAKSTPQEKFLADVVRHAMCHYFAEKDLKAYEKNQRHGKKIDLSGNTKWKKDVSEELETSEQRLINAIPNAVYLKSVEEVQKYQNLIKAKKALPEELEPVKIHPENVEFIKNFFRTKYLTEPNFVHGNKHPFESNTRKNFSETDKSRNEYFNASKSQPESETKGNHVDIQKLALENKNQVLNSNVTKGIDKPSTVQLATNSKLQENYSRKLQSQERDSKALELEEKHPDRFESKATHPTLRTKGNNEVVPKTTGGTSTKKVNKLNLNLSKGLNAMVDSEMTIVLPIRVEGPYKHDKGSTNENELVVGTNTDVEINLHMTLKLPSMNEYMTYESQDNLPKEAYGYDKNISEDNNTQLHKTVKKVTKRETSRKNDNTQISDRTIYKRPTGVPHERVQHRYAKKSIQAAEQLRLSNLEKSDKMFGKRHLNSGEGLSSDEYRLINSTKTNFRMKKSAKKHKVKLVTATANETSTESKQESNYETTTEKGTTLEVDSQKTDTVTTKETDRKNSTFNAEAGSLSLMRSGVIKQESAEISDSKAAKVGKIKYHHNHPSEKIKITLDDGKKHSFELKDNSNNSTLKLESVSNNTKTDMEFEDQNETSTKPIQEVTEGNYDETMKGGKAISVTGDDHSSTNENSTETSKLEKKVQTMKFRQLNMMTTENTIQDNITTAKDIASTLPVNNNPESTSLKDGNYEIEKSTGKNSTVLPKNNKSTNGSTPGIHEDNTAEKNTAIPTESNNSGIRLIKGAAADTVTDPTTENKDKQDEADEIRSNYTIVENSTTVVESLASTSVKGLYNQKANEGLKFRHPLSIDTITEPTTNENRSSYESTDKHVKSETEKQVLMKEDESEMVDQKESKKDGTQSGQSETAGEKIDVSPTDQSLESNTEGPKVPKGKSKKQRNKK